MFAHAAEPTVHDELARCLHALVAEHLGVGIADLAPGVSLVDDLAADSLDLVELALAIEQTLGVVLPRRFLDEVRTCGDLVDATLAVAQQRRRTRGVDERGIEVRVRRDPARGRSAA